MYLTQCDKTAQLLRLGVLFGSILCVRWLSALFQVVFPSLVRAVVALEGCDCSSSVLRGGILREDVEVSAVVVTSDLHTNRAGVAEVLAGMLPECEFWSNCWWFDEKNCLGVITNVAKNYFFVADDYDTVFELVDGVGMSKGNLCADGNATLVVLVCFCISEGEVRCFGGTFSL